MASKTQMMAVKVLTGKGNIEAAVRIALWANVESGNSVYLDNAKELCGACGMNAHQFAGGLSALQAKEEYKPMDGFFGMLIQHQHEE